MPTRTGTVVARVTEDAYMHIQTKRRQMEERDLVEYSIADALDEILMEWRASQ